VKRNAIKTTQKKRKHENATGSANGFNSANSIGETNCKRRKKGELTKNSKDPTAERKRKLIGEKKWHEKLDQAISFHKKHGHWRIKPHQSKHSKADKDIISTQKLKHWIDFQKSLYKTGKIRPDRLEKLKAAGFPLWKKDGEATTGENATEGPKIFAATPLEKKWEDHYQKVILFKQQYGHWLLPVKSQDDEGFIEYRKLRNWIATQKSDYNAGCLREDRLKKLRDIGFPLDNTCVGTRVQQKLSLEDQKWIDNFEKSINFYLRHGAWTVRLKQNKSKCTKMDEKSLATKKLMDWIRTQRRYYILGKLRADRLKRLKEVGFPLVEEDEKRIKSNLDLREERWDYQYHLAKIFYEKHGYWTVPFKRNLDPTMEDDATIDINNLMNWIRVQKYYYQVGKLRPDRLKRLRSIGFPLADDDEKILPDLNIAGQKSNAEKMNPGQLWRHYFEQSILFHKHHGYWTVPIKRNFDPTKEDDETVATQKLMNWIKIQKYNYKTGKLKADRLNQLKEAGFPLGDEEAVKFPRVNVSKWMSRFQALKKYKEDHGNIEVPEGYTSPETGSKLSYWIQRQRVLYKNDALPVPLINRLTEELGFNLDGQGAPYGFPSEEEEFKNIDDTNWKKIYGELKRYHSENGNAEVYEENDSSSTSSLGIWADQQRQLYLDGNLTKEKIRLLNALGFNFYKGKATYSSCRLLELNAYHKANGNFDVPETYPANMALGTWLHNQKLAYIEGKLPSELQTQLEEIGFDFSNVAIPDNDDGNERRRRKNNRKSGGTRIIWQTRYDELKAYLADTGTFDSIAADSPLGVRLNRQKEDYASQRLHFDREEKLKELGFDFGNPPVQETVWDDQFEELRIFRQEFGHTAVPRKFKPNPQLYHWCVNQRLLFKRGTLSSTREKLLSDIEFDFIEGPGGSSSTRKSFLNEEEWEAVFQKLLEYKILHGDANVPQKYDKDGLSSFTQYMRFYYKVGKLSSDRIERLKIIGFSFNPNEDRWNCKFEELKRHKEMNGTCYVSKHEELGKWTRMQITAFRKGSLTEERKKRLDEIGFDIAHRKINKSNDDDSNKKVSPTEVWDAMFNKLLQFKKEHGNTLVPEFYPDDPAFALWVGSQRVKYHNGSLSREYADRLNDVGFDWKSAEMIDQEFLNL